MIPGRLPAWLQQFVDDASMFPPGNLPLAQAVQEHRAHQASEYGGLVGGFVVSEGRLPELVDLLDELDEEEPLGINLVVTGGVGAVEPAVRWATRAGSVRLDAVEYALRDEDDLPRQAQRLCQMVDNLGADLGLDPAETPVYAEPPRLDGPPSPGWLGALDELAALELRLKFRTGGVTPDAFPTAGSLAACIGAALDRELPFKCTAGLHHAVRNDADGLPHHGFLNVLAATRACLDGGDPVEALSRSTDVLAGLDDDALLRTRRWFTAFGSCSVLEPHEDLVELGLLG